jgi:hypothetical protein
MKIVAVLESMWDWRQMTSGAGYKEAPRSFRINPDNYSGKRLYRIVGRDADLHVTNACRELCGSANHHGTPDPDWLRENLELLAPFDVLLVSRCHEHAQYEIRVYAEAMRDLVRSVAPVAVSAWEASQQSA